MFVNELLPILKAHAKTHAETMFLACQLAHANNGGQSWVSHARVSDETGISVRSSKRAAADLAKRGVIAISTDCGVRTVYTFPCLDHPEHPLDMVAPAPAPVVAKNATAAEPAPKPAPAPKPEPVPVPVPTPEPMPATEHPTGDNPSPVAERETVQQPAPAKAAPAPVQQPVAKPQPEPAPAPVSVAPMPALEPLPPTPAQPRAQQPAPAPVVSPVAAQEQKPAPMPALEPAPPTPGRNIVSARVARLPDVDEAVRREVDARPVVKSSSAAQPDDDLMARARKLAALCAENTARSLEQKRAAQRFMEGVTAATEQVAKQRAAQDIAAARQRAAQDAAPPAVPVTGQKPDEQPTPEKTTNGQNAGTARDAAVRDGCYPADGKTNSPEPVAPDTAATAPIVLPAPVVVQEPQPLAATPQQGELLPAPAKQSRSVKTVAVQGELLPVEKIGRATRLPEDWQLPRSWGIWAMEMFGFTEDQVRYQADKFRDHWTSTTRNPTKKDWFGTWRNWMRKANERGERFDYNSRPDQQKSKMTQALENLANTNFDWEHQETWNLFAPPTPEETEAARKREEARAAAEIAKAAMMREDAKRNKDRK